MISKTTLIAFLPCIVAACQNGPYEPVGVTSLQFDDVVVPSGFRLQDDESHSREDATFRTGHWLYYGGMHVDEAAMHVTRHMPRHSWSCTVDEQLEEEGKHLRFERGIYTADYRLRRQDGRTEMTVDYETDYTRR